MNQFLIFRPVLCMFALTGLVWLWMYLLRLPSLLRSGLDMHALATPHVRTPAVSPHLLNPADNLRNLCELPMVFYAVCVVLYVTSSVDAIYMAAAWEFVVFRVLHSLVHCTFNGVGLRFATYLFSSLALWFMVLRLAQDWFGGVLELF